MWPGLEAEPPRQKRWKKKSAFCKKGLMCRTKAPDGWTKKMKLC